MMTATERRKKIMERKVFFDGVDTIYEATFIDGDKDNDIAVLELILNGTGIER